MSERVKRMVASMMLALALAAGIHQVMNVPVPSVCQLLTPDDWFLWWLYSCGKDAGGGGGSGAGQM